MQRRDINVLSKAAQKRGRDSSGLMSYSDGQWTINRMDVPLQTLLKRIPLDGVSVAVGHSRLVTNGLADNQPVAYEDVFVLHNGIVVNADEIWDSLGMTRRLQVDTEIIGALAARHIAQGLPLEQLPSEILDRCRGVVACVVIAPKIGRMWLFSNNGSLYAGQRHDAFVFASEDQPLRQIGCVSIEQVRDCLCLEVPQQDDAVTVKNLSTRATDLIPALASASQEASLLEYQDVGLRRCTKCVLPETMPFIQFDAQGVCNYCRNYVPRNNPKPLDELLELVSPYRRVRGSECVVPLSGGRDSSFALHLIVKELGLRPVTFTYDWGMVTDLARRNISRMCGEMGVENILLADDISKKRRYISSNLRAWLRAPHLGMLSLLTAGDKHFFRHLVTVKRDTGVDLNLWGINPLEVTHFKAGFLGVPPDFEESRVYSHGLRKQVRYHSLRFRAMLRSPGYFNRSMWDTLSGEYYRSFSRKDDYFHLFDYWRWDEGEIDSTLEEYDWERAPDTRSTWRIGDGTAAFYNYVYFTVAGFTEHDTFRSNQIREGDITREQGLALVREENQPRYQNIKWYLDVLGFDFGDVISEINRIPRLLGDSQEPTRASVTAVPVEGAFSNRARDDLRRRMSSDHGRA